MNLDKLQQIRAQLTEMLGLALLHGKHQLAQWICDTTAKLNAGCDVPAVNCQQLSIEEHDSLPIAPYLKRSADCLKLALENIAALEQPAAAGFSKDITAHAEATVDLLLTVTTELLRKLRLYQDLQ